ncbi:MAG: hypothetical protein LM577_08735 [Thermoproteaceae archaeon]|nr:hypothetical protein [Thermoproteaceae archaeon]
MVEAVAAERDLALKLASAVAGVIAVPLDVATKRDVEDMKRELADLKARVQSIETRVQNIEGRIQDVETRVQNVERGLGEVRKMIRDVQRTLEGVALTVEESGRDWVQHLLGQRGYRCAAERLVIEGAYEFDIYCNAGTLTAVGEAKVRAGGRDVERVAERAGELARRWPERVSGRLVPLLYALAAEPSAAQRARELSVWLVESRRELVTLEEALSAR